MPIDRGLRRLALRTLLAAFPGPSAPDWALDLLAEAEHWMQTRVRHPDGGERTMAET